MQTGISIGSETFAAWLQAVKEAEIPFVECEAGVFDRLEDAKLFLDNGIRSLVLRNLVQDDGEQEFAVAHEAHSERELYRQLFKTMHNGMLMAQANAFSVPLRLDRVQPEDWEMRSVKIAASLNRLLSAPLKHSFSLQVPVRFPLPFPGSSELTRAMELCEIVNGMEREKWNSEAYGLEDVSPIFNGTAVKLCAQIYPEENVFPEDFFEYAPMEHIGSIVFHYDVSSYETLYDDEQENWAQSLKGCGYEGQVFFAPSGAVVAQYPKVLEDISAWMELYK